MGGDFILLHEALKAPLDLIEFISNDRIKYVGIQKKTNEARSKIIARVAATFKANPIAEVTLILARHPRQIPIE